VGIQYASLAAPTHATAFSGGGGSNPFFEALAAPFVLLNAPGLIFAQFFGDAVNTIGYIQDMILPTKPTAPIQPVFCKKDEGF